MRWNAMKWNVIKPNQTKPKQTTSHTGQFSLQVEHIVPQRMVEGSYLSILPCNYTHSSPGELCVLWDLGWIPVLAAISLNLPQVLFDCCKKCSIMMKLRRKKFCITWKFSNKAVDCILNHPLFATHHIRLS